jgi:hypothetical protein
MRDPAERPAAEQLLVDLVRLRKHDALFNDIIGGAATARRSQRWWRISPVLATPGEKRLSPGCGEQYARNWSHFASGDEPLCIGVLGKLYRSLGCELRAVQTYGPSRF